MTKDQFEQKVDNAAQEVMKNAKVYNGVSEEDIIQFNNLIRRIQKEEEDDSFAE